MFLDPNIYNILPLNSSFRIEQLREEEEEDLFSMRTGSVFGYENGEASVITGDFTKLTKDIYIGIESSISGLNPTGAALYNSTERAQKKSDEGAFWTWVELINEEGEIFGIQSDILMRKRGITLKDPYVTNVSLEEFEDEIILKIAHKEERRFDSPYTVKTFQVFDDGEDVLCYRLSDPEDFNSSPIFELKKIGEYEPDGGNVAIAIINAVEFLIVGL
tara:strand:+ start:213 stop:866 length:654 start_codon:yes stop_codon:yes gene_type:complete